MAILPLALMSGIALQALLEQQRRQTEQSSLDLARALATAVDTELRLTISALQSLALTEPLGSAPRSTSPTRTNRRGASSRRAEWRAVLLARRGQPLFSTVRAPNIGACVRRVMRHAAVIVASLATPAGVAALHHRDAFGAPPAPSRSGEPRRGGAHRAPVVGSLTRGPLGNFGVPVRVPVERDGQLRYVLSAVVRPEAILRVVSEQRVPDDWIVSVFDGEQRPRRPLARARSATSARRLRRRCRR